ncbi:MAG: hypothetical protein PHU23_02990 [Dehalococcoidales bacterium]|nr:hypothetical protein [Dehalococcoidales bacterium]
MKKIGILLSSTDCDRYNYDTIRELAKSDKVQLYYLLNNNPAEKSGLWTKIRRNIKSQGFWRFAASVFFGRLEILERKMLFLLTKNQGILAVDKRFNIDEFTRNPVICLDPVYSASGLLVRYSDEDIKKIKSLNLDLMVRANAGGIFKGKILNSSEAGIISFHHGDNHWNRGGPPGFWEVYYRKPSTGFIIQQLNEEIDGGEVLFRGEISTRRSFTENILALLNESNPYMAKLILDYAEKGVLPPYEEKIPFSGKLYRTPSIIQSINYVFRTSALFIKTIINFFILRRRDRWHVAYLNGHWSNAVLRKGTQIKNIRRHFFADPFVVTKNNRTIIFVEDFSFEQSRGCISAIEIIDKKNYKILGPVLEEPFHMSFPFLFEYKNELFMIPETFESNSIRLYKCMEFPMKWQHYKDIMKDCSAVDSMVFKHNNLWWLFTNMVIEGGLDFNSKLVAYYNSDPLSDAWILHASSPLVFDSNKARNGGILDISGNSPVRVRQKQGFNSYGAAFTMARIKELTPSSYIEQEIASITPEFFPGLKGCHHLHSNGEYTVYDFYRVESIQ